MTQHDTWKWIQDNVRAAWSAVGPLVGVLVGAWLTRSGDHKKWINDNRKEEYRELVTALTSSAMRWIEDLKRLEMGRDGLPDTGERYMHSLQTIQDRIFIAKELGELNVFDRWGNLVKGLRELRNANVFEDGFGKLTDEIVKAATRQV